jgi:hypothetical protein
MEAEESRLLETYSIPVIKFIETLIQQVQTYLDIVGVEGRIESLRGRERSARTRPAQPDRDLSVHPDHEHLNFNLSLKAHPNLYGLYPISCMYSLSLDFHLLPR